MQANPEELPHRGPWVSIRSRANLEIACQRIGERMNEWGMDLAIRSFVIHSVTGHGGRLRRPIPSLKTYPRKNGGRG